MTEEVWYPGDFVEKFKAFGFEVLRVDGSDIKEIYDAIIEL